MRYQPPPTTFTPEQLIRAVKGWCWDCGERVPNYLVYNEVWDQAWPKHQKIGVTKLERLKEAATKQFPERPRSPHSNRVHVRVYLCFGCLELRLKRRLKITDFRMLTAGDKPLAENAPVFLGYQLGYRAAERALAKKAEESGDKKDEGD